MHLRGAHSWACSAGTAASAWKVVGPCRIGTGNEQYQLEKKRKRKERKREDGGANLQNGWDWNLNGIVVL